MCPKCQPLKITDLLRMVHPLAAHPKILVMLNAYLDESGIHDGAAICVIAGYFGGPGQWRKFEGEWRKALAASGVPLAEFHANKFVEGRGYFFGWPPEQKRRMANDLAQAIVAHKIYPISFGLVVSDFKALSEPQKRFFTGATIDDAIKPGKLTSPGCPTKPYFMPWLQLVKRVAQYAPHGGKAHFFFGLDRPFAKSATLLYRATKTKAYKQYRLQLGDIAFPLAKETPQLQAADYLVYLTYKHMTERHAANDWNVLPAHPLGTLLSRRRTAEDLVYYNHESIADTLDFTYQQSGNWDGHIAQ